VIVYLVFFQLDSVGVKFFRGFIYSYSLYQMHQVRKSQRERKRFRFFFVKKLLEFLVNEHSLSTIKSQCRKIYDEDYIDEKLIGAIQSFVIFYLKDTVDSISSRFCFSHLPDIRSILVDLKNHLEGRTGIRSIPEPTKTKPFNLTLPKPRPVPIPKIVCRNSNQKKT